MSDTTTSVEEDAEGEIDEDWLTRILEESPTALYPTPLGMLSINEAYNMAIDLLVNASYIFSEDPEHTKTNTDESVTVVFNADKYIALLESLLQKLYADFNLLIQYATMSLLMRSGVSNTVEINKLGIPPDISSVLSGAGENALKLLLRGFTQNKSFSSLSVYASEYNIDNIMAFYKLMPQHIKDLMEDDMQEVIAYVYSVDKK